MGELIIATNELEIAGAVGNFLQWFISTNEQINLRVEDTNSIPWKKGFYLRSC
ncbi:MAG: hypothetical protein H7Y31_04785 [Chitinophagaceae bacterium]|nr:hypothetical protein [Chitinophagaceae bacterium]